MEIWIERLWSTVTWIIFSSTGPLASAWLIWFAIKRSEENWIYVVMAVTESLWWLGLRWSIATRLDEKSETLRPGCLRRSLSRNSIKKLVEEEISIDRKRGRELLAGWFFNAKYEQLRKKDVLRWWCWVEANASSLEETENHQEIVQNVEKIEELLGPFAPDDSPCTTNSRIEQENQFAQCARLNLDSVRDRATAKPLWLYLLLRGSSVVISFVLMKSLGFRRIRVGGIRYWLWQNYSMRKTEPPVLFLHGLGLGIAPYASMIIQLFRDAKFRNASGFVVPDLWYVAMVSPVELALRGGVPDRIAHLDAIRHALNTLNATCFDIFSHSYGSIIAGWLVKFEPKMVSHLALAEPVSILLHYSRVCRKFLYDLEPTGTSLIKAIIRRAVALDACIVHVMMRSFWWQENSLFLSDLASLEHSPLVLLSECDEYCPSSLIRERLVDKPDLAKVLFFPGASHGDIVMNLHLNRTCLAEFCAVLPQTQLSPPQ
mmetsp:Transcript_16334/g.21351  ORF Transcript_16334/g.21351 Transcript_16334/m.21351 type:complete len:487 (+) Transcript_16334:192-1652(+)